MFIWFLYLHSALSEALVYLQALIKRFTSCKIGSGALPASKLLLFDVFLSCIFSLYLCQTWPGQKRLMWKISSQWSLLLHSPSPIHLLWLTGSWHSHRFPQTSEKMGMLYQLCYSHWWYDSIRELNKLMHAQKVRIQVKQCYWYWLSGNSCQSKTTLEKRHVFALLSLSIMIISGDKGSVRRNFVF